MATNLPDAPAEPTGITAMLFAESRARQADNKVIVRMRQNRTVAATLAAIANEDDRPERSKKRRRIRSAAAAYYPELPASETDSEPDNVGEELELPELQEDSAASRKILPTKSARKRRATAEDVLGSRSKRQSRRSQEGECPFASDAEPDFSDTEPGFTVPATVLSNQAKRQSRPSGEAECPFASDAEPESYVPTTASSKLRAKEYPIAILLPNEYGRDIVIRNGIPAQLTTMLRDEVSKCLMNDLRVGAWNDIEPRENASCMLDVVESSLFWARYFQGQDPHRACLRCTNNATDIAMPRPCIMLRTDTKGERYIVFLPLVEDLREGKEWKERGFWVNEIPRAPTTWFDALRAQSAQDGRRT